MKQAFDFKQRRRRTQTFQECIPELLTWRPHRLRSGFCRRWPWTWRGWQTVVSREDGEKWFILLTRSSGLIRLNPLNGWFSHCPLNEQSEFHIQHTLARQLWDLAIRHVSRCCHPSVNSLPSNQSCKLKLVSPVSSWSAGRWLESWTAVASL